MNRNKSLLTIATFLAFSSVSIQATLSLDTNGLYIPKTEFDGLEFFPQNSEFRNLCTNPENSKECDVIRQALNEVHGLGNRLREYALLEERKRHITPLSTWKKTILHQSITQKKKVIESDSYPENVSKSINQLLSSVKPQQQKNELDLMNQAIENALYNNSQGPLNYTS